MLTPGSQPVMPEGASGRLELARWLTDVEGGAGALTARVLANRVWHHMVGRGLVRTVDNFGRTGEAPTGEFSELLNQVAVAGKLISAEVNMAGLADILGVAGRTNVQGEEVMKLDDFSDKTVVEILRDNPTPDDLFRAAAEMQQAQIAKAAEAEAAAESEDGEMN